MPKQKTHSGAKKRFKLTATGKLVRRRGMKGHRLEGQSKKVKRDFDRDVLVEVALDLLRLAFEAMALHAAPAHELAGGGQLEALLRAAVGLLLWHWSLSFLRLPARARRLPSPRSSLSWAWPLPSPRSSVLLPLLPAPAWP